MTINTKNKGRHLDSCSSLRKKLNLNYTKWSNKSYPVGEKDLLHLPSPSNVNIDYLALYSKPSEYNATSNTCVCFYEYDNVFDNQNGMWSAIYYDNKKQLKEFKDRFKNVKYFISPDYTLTGDGYDCDNAHNIQRARIVSLWMIHGLHKIVIPNITYGGEETFKYFIDGLEECYVVAFSTKGSLLNKDQCALMVRAINLVVDKLTRLRTIIVYSTSIDDFKILSLFKTAIDNGITVIIPNNLLKSRNLIIKGDKNGKIY